MATNKRSARLVSQTMNECWPAEFRSDALWDGRRYLTFNVVDDFNREALAIEVDLNLPSQRVVCLERIAAAHGHPPQAEIGHRPEFIAVTLQANPSTHLPHYRLWLSLDQNGGYG
jgi:putative transposase